MRKGIWKKAVAAAMAVGMAGSIFAGCGKRDSSSAKSTDSKKVTTVTIGTQEMPNDEGIAKAKDLLEKNMGVKVKLVKFSSGKDVNNALKAKSIDFGLEGSTVASLALSSNIPIKVVWIHEVLGDIESLAVRKKDNIKSIKDLKGKKIAVPFATTSHYCLLRYLSSQGLSEKDVTLLDMDPNSAFAAWKRGDVDAAWIWQPALQNVLDDGGEILVSNGDAAKEGYMTANVEVVREDFAKEHPELVQKYVKTMLEAQKYYKENKEEAQKDLGKDLGLSSKDIETQMKGSTWLSAKEQLSNDYFGTSDKIGALADNLLDTAKFLKDQKNITKVPAKSVFEKAVAPEYIEKALK